MTTEIHGFCDERFRPLKDAFVQNFEDGLEVGASLAVTHKGKFVVDLWAGHADFARTKPWEKDTIVWVASIVKMAVALSFFMLLDRGKVKLDAPIAAYWPEFAAGGKAHVTVRDALTHRAGVPGFDPPVTLEQLLDWDVATGNLAASSHWFNGERHVLYHGNTYGLVLGEIMRRVDGRKPAQFFREEIAEKSGADFHIGLRTRDELSRVATTGFLTPPVPHEHPDPVARRMLASAPWAPPEIDRTSWEYLSSGDPSGVGIGNARSIARFCAIGAMSGTLDGVRYFSKELAREAATEQVYEFDAYIGSRVRWGLGFALPSQDFPFPPPRSFFWVGFGGSLGVMDLSTGLSFGYSMNNLIADFPSDVRQPRFWKALSEVSASL